MRLCCARSGKTDARRRAETDRRLRSESSSHRKVSEIGAVRNRFLNARAVHLREISSEISTVALLIGCSQRCPVRNDRKHLKCVATRRGRKSCAATVPICHRNRIRPIDDDSAGRREQNRKRHEKHSAKFGVQLQHAKSLRVVHVSAALPVQSRSSPALLRSRQRW